MDPTSVNNLITWDLGAVGTLLLVILGVVYRQNKLLRELYDWHDKEDDDGVKVWYMRKGLEAAITRLADGIASQNALMERLVERMERLDQDVRFNTRHKKD